MATQSIVGDVSESRRELVLSMPSVSRLERSSSSRATTPRCPVFEFVYDEHWDLGHGWSGDMPR